MRGLLVRQTLLATGNAENLGQYESRFSLIVELVLPFDSRASIVRARTAFVREMKDLSPNFKYIALRMFYVIKPSHSDS